MATSYVFSDTLVDPSDGAQSGVTVTATLTDRNHRPVLGLTDTGTVVEPKSTTTNGSGVFSLTLFANASIAPVNTFYSIRLGERQPILIEVTGNGDIQDLIADNPDPLEELIPGQTGPQGDPGDTHVPVPDDPDDDGSTIVADGGVYVLQQVILSDTIRECVVLSQAAYDALSPPATDILYVIVN